jgi:phosphohistidine phosphatase
MKTLYLVRHAKSSWEHPGLSDFERPLNDRGKRDAPRMGKRLRKRNILPAIILTSTARRARSTAKKIAREIGYDLHALRFVQELYHADPETLLKAVHSLPESAQSAMLVGHNPGLTDFVNEYIDVRIDNIPTCGIVAATFHADSWKDLGGEKGKLLFFDYPKQGTD